MFQLSKIPWSRIGSALAASTFAVSLAGANPIAQAQDAVDAATARDEVVESVVTPPEMAPEMEVIDTPEPAREASAGLLTVDFEDTPIRNILRNVATLASLNVVIPDALQGNTSLSIRNVTWQQIFDIVLQDTGFSWVKDGDIIRISRLSPQDLVTVDEDGLVSLRFQNDPLRSALQALADRIDRNIIIPPDVTGTTSATLSGVTWERALSGVLEPHNLQWYEDEGIIRLRRVDSRVMVDDASGLMTIEVDRTPFQEVLTLIGRTQIPVTNIISPPELENIPVSLRVNDVTMEDALDLVISKLPREALVDPADPAASIRYQPRRQSANLIRIIDSASLDRDPPVVRIFPIRYAEADLVLRNLRRGNDGFIVRGVQNIQSDPSNNILIVTGTNNSFPELAELIETLDQPARQISIESRFVEVSDIDERQLGVNWTSLRRYQMGVGEIQREWGRGRTQTRTFEDAFGNESTRERRHHTGDGSQFDIGGASLNTDGGIGFSSGTLTNNLTGERLLDASSTFGGQVREFDNVDSSFGRRSVDLSSVATTARVDQAIFSADGFSLILSALAEDTDAKLTSNPTIVTLNGQEANILIEERRFRAGPPVVGDTGLAQPGGPIPLEVQPQTRLTVTPTVIGGDLISLNVRPEINNIVDIQTVSGSEIPIVRRRLTESTVLLRSGYTLAIGGLMDEDEFKLNTKVPFLGDLPLLGRLFRHEQISNRTRNQIIFITARILNAQTDTYEDVVGLDRLNQMGLTSRDVQGVGARPFSEEEEELQRSILQARERIRERAELERIRRQLEALDPEASPSSDHSPREQQTRRSRSR